MISSVLRVEFTHWDFAVLLAADGREAEDYASQTVAHLIVLDTGKQHLGAYEACVRIRRRAGYAERPIVLTANDPSDRMMAAAERAGATALLPKPYSVRDLFAAVTPHLAADDPLLTSRARRPGTAEQKLEWTGAPSPAQRSGSGSALTRNGLLLPIVRGRGVKIPLIRKP